MNDGDAEREWEKTTRDVARRQRRLPMPKDLSRAVSQFVTRWGIAETQSARELEQAWQDVAGPALAARTRVGAVRRGVCEITVENSSLLQQLIFQQRDILQRLQAQKPHFAITQIRFRVGPIR